jgi:tRNA nucleotidyltransferase/poly(A) polymerase
MLNISEKLTNSQFIKIIKLAGKVGFDMGIKTYIVGGYLRDIILERKLTDIDIMVEDKVIDFSNNLAKELGVNKTIIFEKFHTVKIPFKDCEIEVANARKETYDSQSRKPNTVEKTTVEEDLIRRDFTINALASSITPDDFGNLIDTFNGLIDLNNRIINTPTDPDITFIDDPLRMLRAIRFAAQLKFEIHPRLKKSIEKNKDRISIVSKERVTAEIIKILKADTPSISFYLLKELDFLKLIFPELDIMSGIDIIDNKGHKDVFIHTLEVVDNAAKLSNKMEIRFAALVHDIAKPATKRFNTKKGWTFHGHEEIGKRMLIKIAKRMKISNELRDYLMILTKLHLRPIALAKKEISDSAVRRVMYEAGEHIDDLMKLCRADITTKNPIKINKYMGNFERVEILMQDVKMKDEMKSFQSPIGGAKIMEVFSLKEGKVVGEIKKSIEDAILDETIPNTYEDAYNYMLKIKDNFIKN